MTFVFKAELLVRDNRETSDEMTAIKQVRTWDSEQEEEEADSLYVLKVAATGFATTFDVGCVKRGNEDDFRGSRFCHLSPEKTLEKNEFGGESEILFWPC